MPCGDVVVVFWMLMATTIRPRGHRINSGPVRHINIIHRLKPMMRSLISIFHVLQMSCILVFSASITM